MRLAHDLNFDAFGLEVVEYELGARGSLGVDSSCDPNLHILEMLPSLNACIFLKKVSKVSIGVEFVRIGIQRSAGLELSDLAAPDFEVLLGRISRRTRFAWWSRTFGVSSASVSSADAVFSFGACAAGCEAALAAFFSSCSLCLMRFLSSLLLLSGSQPVSRSQSPVEIF